MHLVNLPSYLRRPSLVQRHFSDWALHISALVAEFVLDNVNRIAHFAVVCIQIH